MGLYVLSDHAVVSLSVMSLHSDRQNVAPEGLAQDAAWWLYLLFAGFQEVPETPLGTSWSNLTGLTDLDGGKEWGREGGRACSRGVFVQVDKQIERQWMLPAGWSLHPVQVFVAWAAVMIRLQSLFHDFLHSSCFFPQIGYHGIIALFRQLAGSARLHWCLGNVV